MAHARKKGLLACEPKMTNEREEDRTLPTLRKLGHVA